MMSRRSVTTITIQVRLRTPPGSNTAEVLEYVRNAMRSYKGGGDPKEPINSLDTDSMIVKLERKETTYL
jgi:hypothetical protein